MVQLTASGRTIPDYMKSGRLKKLQEFLIKRRKEFGLDVLTLIDAGGKVILRTHYPFHVGDNQTSNLLIQKALQGKTVASTEIVS